MPQRQPRELSLLFPYNDLERNAGHHLLINDDVDGVEASLVELNLLKIENEVSRVEENVLGQFYVHVGFDVREDVFAVLIDEAEFELVRAFVRITKDYAEGDGAVRMRGWEGGGDDGVECAENAQLAAVIRRRIAKNCCLDFHNE